MKTTMLFLCLWIPWLLSAQDVISVQLENSDNVIVVNISGDNNVVNVYPPSPPPAPSGGALKLTFDDIANAALMIGGTVTDVSDWNTFFDLPEYGTPFTSVAIDNDTVKLSGGDGITLRGGLFSNNDYYASIIGVVDDAGCLDSLERLVDEETHETSTPFYYYYPDPQVEQACAGLVYFEAENITTAGNACFSGCTSLTSTGSITTAGNACFSGCTSLTSTGSITTAGDGCFYGCTSLTSTGSITTAGDECFYGCTSLTSTGSITTAGNACFYGCTSLTSTGSITTAGDGCFAGCTSLTSTGSITTAGDKCFYGCTSLVTIDLSECTNLGTDCTDNGVFTSITGNTITVTCAAGLLTCNEGAPDGDLFTLAANNTVTLNGNPFTFE